MRQPVDAHLSPHICQQDPKQWTDRETKQDYLVNLTSYLLSPDPTFTDRPEELNVLYFSGIRLLPGRTRGIAFGSGFGCSASLDWTDTPFFPVATSAVYAPDS